MASDKEGKVVPFRKPEKNPPPVEASPQGTSSLTTIGRSLVRDMAAEVVGSAGEELNRVVEGALSNVYGGIRGHEIAEGLRERNKILDEIHKRYPNGRRAGEDVAPEPPKKTDRKGLRVVK